MELVQPQKQCPEPLAANCREAFAEGGDSPDTTNSSINRSQCILHDFYFPLLFSNFVGQHTSGEQFLLSFVNHFVATPRPTCSWPKKLTARSSSTPTPTPTRLNWQLWLLRYVAAGIWEYETTPLMSGPDNSSQLLAKYKISQVQISFFAYGFIASNSECCCH